MKGEEASQTDEASQLVENASKEGARRARNIENSAIRIARLARNSGADGGLDWDSARIACKRAAELLTDWEKTQPHPHSP